MRSQPVAVRVWCDRKFRAMGVSEQVVALYCLTGQPNRVGLFRFSPGMAAEDLGMTLDGFTDSFESVRETFGWEWDAENRVLYIPTWWKYNTPQTVKQFSSMLEDLADLPDTPLLVQFAKNDRYLPKKMADVLKNIDLTEAMLAAGQVTAKTAEKLPEPVAEAVQEPEPVVDAIEPPAAPEGPVEPPEVPCERYPGQEDEPLEPYLGGEEEDDGVAPWDVGFVDPKTKEEIKLTRYTFPIVGKGPSEWTLSQEDYDEYVKAFPHLDIDASLRKAVIWIKTNPPRRKTARGMLSFLTSWLSREQNANNTRTATSQMEPQHASRDRSVREFTPIERSNASEISAVQLGSASF